MKIGLKIVDHCQYQRLIGSNPSFPDVGDVVKTCRYANKIMNTHSLTDPLEIRQSEHEELDEIMGIYNSARSFMIEKGKPDQWSGGSPQKEVIVSDIENGQHFVCIDKDRILGCFAFIYGEDPTYLKIDKGGWLNDLPHATLHRLAVVEHGKGDGSFCINWCLDQHKNISVDTHKNNTSMQQLLAKHSFHHCGIIYNRWGDKRVAYQKT